MEQDELEQKVTMAEELILGLVKRMEVIESELPEFLKSFLEQYKETLANISGQIEKSNKRYDDQRISQQIDQVKDLVGTMPKVITVKKRTSPPFRGMFKKTLHWCSGLFPNHRLIFRNSSVPEPRKQLHDCQSHQVPSD
nr:hypothetical protein [uncultured Pedobacter sp.]